MPGDLNWAFEGGRGSWNRMPSPSWQKHHHMGSTAIDPHWEERECLAVEGVGWISHRDFTRYLVKEWGISLCLIRPANRGAREQIAKRSGY
jgi:fatty-acid desaturase